MVRDRPGRFDSDGGIVPLLGPMRAPGPQPDTTPPDPTPRAAARRLVAVVVTHDRLALLKATVGALLAEPPARLAGLIVVDNASADGTGDWLASCADPRLTVLTLPRNLGGAGGFEAGMRHAVARTDADWIVVMDDDARPEPGTIAAFHALDLTGWDGVAGAVRDPQGAPCDVNRPTLDPFRRPGVLLRSLLGRGREGFHLGPADFERPGLRAVDGASFVGLFLSRAAVERGGYPDGRLFLYADDAMYTLGLTRDGARLAFDPALRFLHETTTYTRADPRIRPLWKVYYRHRNLMLLYRQLSGRLFWAVMLLYLPRWAMRARHHRGERGRFLRIYALAVRDGFARRLDRPHAEIVDRAGGPG